jgi:hypothetical protein
MIIRRHTLKMPPLIIVPDFIVNLTHSSRIMRKHERKMYKHINYEIGHAHGSMHRHNYVIERCRTDDPNKEYRVYVS